MTKTWYKHIYTTWICFFKFCFTFFDHFQLISSKIDEFIEIRIKSPLLKWSFNHDGMHENIWYSQCLLIPTYHLLWQNFNFWNWRQVWFPDGRHKQKYQVWWNNKKQSKSKCLSGFLTFCLLLFCFQWVSVMMILYIPCSQVDIFVSKYMNSVVFAGLWVYILRKKRISIFSSNFHQIHHSHTFTKQPQIYQISKPIRIQANCHQLNWKYTWTTQNIA